MSDFRGIQKEAFAKLVDQGVYSEEFKHSSDAETFFIKTIVKATENINSKDDIHVLDVGCGTGVWLRTLIESEVLKSYRLKNYYGFDLTEKMIDVAKLKFSDVKDSYEFIVGDVLSDNTYQSFSNSKGFDLIYCYDVIQQLPKKLKMRGIETIINNLREGGVAIIFDHDHSSKYGKSMAFKKFVTKYLKYPLVPRYYCNANYPDLTKIKQNLCKSSELTAKLIKDDLDKKYALIVIKLLQ